MSIPQVGRTVRVIAKPVASGLFSNAITAKTSLSMSAGVSVDSYDSTNSNESTNGQYDSSKAQADGNVAVDASGNSSDLADAYINGNASSDGGTLQGTSPVTKNKGVQGNVYNNFSTTFPTVSDPVFSTMNTSVTTVNLQGS